MTPNDALKSEATAILTRLVNTPAAEKSLLAQQYEQRLTHLRARLGDDAFAALMAAIPAPKAASVPPPIPPPDPAPK
jgi:hypothetical protein